MSDDEDPTPPDPAERRTAELLALVATRPYEPGEGFTPELVRRVRHQRAVAAPLRAVGAFLSAIAGAVVAAAAAAGRRP